MIPLMLSLCGPAGAAPPVGPSEAAAAALLAREDELLAAVEARDPEDHARMLRLRETERDAYLVALFRTARIVERSKTDPEVGARREAIRDREEELRRLGWAFTSTPKDQQPAQRARMEELARELIELKQAERRKRLAELQARLERLTQEIAAGEAARDQLVRDYVDQLLQAPAGP